MAVAEVESVPEVLHYGIQYAGSGGGPRIIGETLDEDVEGLCMEELEQDLAELPELTRRYLATFPRHELEYYERTGRLERSSSCAG